MSHSQMQEEQIGDAQSVQNTHKDPAINLAF